MLSLLYCSVVFKEYEDPAMKDILYVTKGMCFVTFWKIHLGVSEPTVNGTFLLNTRLL